MGIIEEKALMLFLGVYFNADVCSLFKIENALLYTTINGSEVEIPIFEVMYDGDDMPFSADIMKPSVSIINTCKYMFIINTSFIKKYIKENNAAINISGNWYMPESKFPNYGFYKFRKENEKEL